MNTIEKLSLIDGTFDNEEAKEILMNLFSTKIHFHELKNFSSQERFAKNCETSQKRIPELKKGKETANEIVLEAKAKNKRLMITSVIQISLVDD
jgi:hypothetical protein